MSEKPFHERVAEALIEQLKAGTAPWQRPWEAGVPYLPTNPVTGKRYRGINTVQLLAQGRGDPRWMTYRQAQSVGAQVQKGEKGTSVQYWKFTEEHTQRDAAGKPVLDAEGNPQKATVLLERPRFFHAVVFNAEQIDGLPALENKPREWDPVQRAEQILKNSGAKIEHGGDRAFYSLAKDTIRLPHQGQFATAASYYATALHELGHWTGHRERLDRDMGHSFGSEGYAREELRAEIASMIVGDELGLGHDPSQHVAYVGHWIRALEQDPLEIFRASSAAEKIHDYVLRFEQQQEQSERSTLHVQEEAASMATEPADSEQEQPAQGVRMYIAVPYRERDEAKAAGARWDRAKRSWYVPEGTNQEPFARWTQPPQEQSEQRATETAAEAGRIYLAVPYGERAAAKAAGARWDRAAKSWYAGPDAAVDKLRRWLPERMAGEQSPAMEPREEFGAALKDMGCMLGSDQPIMDGKPHRLPVDGDRSGEQGGFYVAHLDGHPAGYIKNHRTGIEIRWKAKGYALEQAEQAKLRADAAQKQQDRTAEQAQKHQQTAERLQQELGKLSPATLPTAYMQKKGIGTHPGVYTDAERKTYVPATDAEGKLWTVQYIDADGKKRFAKSSRKHGCFHAVGGLQNLAKTDVLVIAEGYATAATVAELLGKPAVAAFDAGNLLPVAQALRAKYPEKPVLIVADDDQAQEQQTGINPGRQKAKEAAKAVGGRVVMPIFAPGEQRDNPKACSDFNDLAVRSVLGREGAVGQLRYAYEQVLRAPLQRGHEQQPERTRAPQKRARAL